MRFYLLASVGGIEFSIKLMTEGGITKPCLECSIDIRRSTFMTFLCLSKGLEVGEVTTEDILLGTVTLLSSV